MNGIKSLFLVVNQFDFGNLLDQTLRIFDLQKILNEKETKELIENKKSGLYRISTHPDFITYNKEKLLNHQDSHAYTGVSGRQFRRHPDIKPVTSGHLIDSFFY